MHDSPLIRAVRNTFQNALPRLFEDAFETRREQVEMAVEVAAAIDEGRIVVAEAETGLGKSIAYLVPLVLHCERSGARAVISTYTKNLQRQLADKDFPLARRAAGVGVEGAVLMGRSNYACRRRIDTVLEGESCDPALSRWLRASFDEGTGELDAMPGASLFLDADIRRKISCPTRDAVCAGCRVREKCFMLKARRRALDSQVVVTNHALLFSSAAASGALLGPYGVLVVDESHHMEDVATDFFTISYSPRSIRGAPDSVYSPEYDEAVKYVRTIVAGDSTETAETIDGLWQEFLEAVTNADRDTARLFDLLGENVSSTSGRAGESDGARPVNGFDAEQITYAEGTPLFYGAEATIADVSRALGRMGAATGKLREIVNAVEALAESGVAGTFKAIDEAVGETRAQFDFLVSGSSEDHVFYARLDRTNQAAGNRRGRAAAALTASPIDVSARLGVFLEEGSDALVLTSATLAVAGDFSYSVDRFGLGGSRRTVTRQYESPFDLDGRRAVFLADFLPVPTHASFVSEAAAVIEDAVEASGRRTLVLCTARGQVAILKELLSKSPAAGRELFVQSDGSSREDLLARFRTSRSGVLVGLASFWEGIDLPGEELELLIILKLPFMVPTEPVTQARAARVAEAGDNVFEKLFLPDVVLKLRQGMGRLIRTGRDKGAVLILDRRLAHGRYGEHVLRAVTNRHVRCGDRFETIERLEHYFDEQ